MAPPKMSGRCRARVAERRGAFGQSTSEVLRVAFLLYRGNPHCGGQGVYARHLTRELAALGHEVTVFSGQPYPELDAGVALVTLPSLDLYREPDPFRRPRLRELSSPTDLLELATMYSGGFGEPRTFSLRARAALRARRGEFDLVHDDQSLGSGLLGMLDDGWPLLASIHHPVSIDRQLDLQHAALARRASLRRWYRFSKMQDRVARQLERVITVSQSSRRDIAEQMGVKSERIVVIPAGVRTTIFRPLPHIARVPGRMLTTASADVALKGLLYLLEALAKVRTEWPEAHLVVIGKLAHDSPLKASIERLGLSQVVQFQSDLSEEQIATLYAQSLLAVVPSLYEGFSLPAVEAMACAVPVVATTGGALPEVLGPSGECALLVQPGDADGLAAAVLQLLRNDQFARSLGAKGRQRVLEHFTWQKTASSTAAVYRQLLEGRAVADR